MVTDDLNRPLGQDEAAAQRGRLSPWLLRGVAGVLGLALALFVYSALFIDDPLGGEPFVVTSLNALKKDKPPAPTPLPDAPRGTDEAKPKPDPRAAEAAPKTVTIIDGTSGRRQEVTVKEPAAPATPKTTPFAADPRLVEQTRHGGIPKVAQDGLRPADVYARSAKLPGVKADAPRIAIVITGLGTGATRTVEGLRKLPASVTLAFSPYAKDLEQWVARAGGNGHELLLQVPMEPFDYPDNDPGPQTLLTSLAAEQNIDRLHWFMSRFSGYVGVVNYMGDRFTAMEQAFGPVLREIARRGLIYFDDGLAPRSLAAQIAGANNAAFAKADIVIDAAPTAAEIDLALARLEQMARERGRAVGAATALPIAIDRIALWAKEIEGRGVALVPLSAVASRPKSS